MKKRLLPFGFFLFIIGMAFISIAAIQYVGDKTSGKTVSESEYLAKLRNNQVTGQLAAKDVLIAREQVMMNELLRSGNANDLPWNLAGPNNLGGRTRALLFDNRDASGSTIFAGGVYGGMFKTINAGFKWQKINLSTGNLNVTCITQNASGDIFVGTGEGFTSEGYSVLGTWGYTSGLIGQGIYKCTDGENFVLIPSTQPVLNGNDEMEWGYINEIASDQGNRLFVATNTGLKYSDNGGDSWAFARTGDTADLNMLSRDIRISSGGAVIAEVNNLAYVSATGDPKQFALVSGDSTWNLPASGVGRMEFAFAPSNPDVIYALVVTTSGALENVYRSDDKGMNWRVIGPGNSANFKVFGDNNIGLYSCVIEVFPDNADRILIGGTNMWEGIRISEEGFFDWQRRSESTTIPGFIIYAPANHHTYKFNPANPSLCFIGTNGGIFRSTTTSELFKFQTLNKDYTSSQFYTLSSTRDKVSVLGGGQDLGTVKIDGIANASDPKRGSDIWTTVDLLPDGGTGGYCAWSTISPLTVIYSKYPHPARVTVGGKTYETFIRRNEYGGGPDWAAVDRTVGDRYRSAAFLSPLTLWESFKDYNSRDSIKFMAIQDVPAGSVLPLESQNGARIFFHTFTQGISKGDSVMVQDIITSKFFIGGDSCVMMTRDILKFDRIPEYYLIANKTTGFNEVAQSMAYSANANHLFVGTTEGGLFRISNIAYAWDFETADVTSPFCVISTTRIPIYLPGTSTEISQVVTSVAVNPNNANQVIVTLGNYGNDHYVYMTENALAETPVFHSIQGNINNGGLPAIPAYSSLFEMDPDDHTVFIGTEFGIYVSDNVLSSEPTWVPQNNTIGRIPVFMLKQQTIRKADDVVTENDTTVTVYKGVDNYGVIYGATFGRGLIRLDEFQKPVGIFNPGNPASKGPEFKVYPNPASDLARVEFTMENSGKVSLVLFDLNGKVAQQVDYGHMPTGKHQVNLSVDQMASGTYLMKLITGNRSSSGKIIVY